MLDRRVFLGSALASAPAAFGGWEGFPDWTDERVLEILVDSPWARQHRARIEWVARNSQPVTYREVPGADANRAASSTVRGGSPVGGIGGPKPKLPSTADLILRWASALPIRQAKALYQARQAKTPEKAAAMVEAWPGAHVLEVFGVPAIVAHQGDQVVAAKLQDSAWLRTKTGQNVRPSKVDVKVGPLTLTAFLHFPRAGEITEAAREIECYGNVQVFEFREKFKLPAMTYLGRLEL
jgi:hypothetical protein